MRSALWTTTAIVLAAACVPPPEPEPPQRRPRKAFVIPEPTYHYAPPPAPAASDGGPAPSPFPPLEVGMAKGAANATPAKPRESIDVTSFALCFDGNCLPLCDNGDARACAQAAEDGVGEDRAFAALRHGCDLKDGHACYELASVCKKANEARAKTCDELGLAALPSSHADAKKTCAAQPSSDCSKLANDALFARAYALLEKTCLEGAALPCFYAGLGRKFGDGRPADAADARDWFERGCAQGGATSCENAEQWERAVKLHQAWCDRGYGAECAALASMYASGRGVAQDDAKAKALEQRACRIGWVGPSCPR